MSTCQSLRLEDAALWDSMESGDISMDCLFQKMPFLQQAKKKKPNKIGQQNLVGGKSDKAQFSRWVWLLWKEKDKQSAEQDRLSRAPCASHGGSSQEHINIWISVIWLSHPWMKYVMNHMRSANEAERQEWDEKKEILFGKKETLLSLFEET